MSRRAFVIALTVASIAVGAPDGGAWKKDYLLSRGGDAYANGRFDEAATLFRSVLKQEPDDLLAAKYLAALALKKNALEQARGYFEQGLRGHPDSFDLHHELGALLIRLNKPVEAVPHFEAATALNAKSVDAAVNWGDALRLAGQTPKAVEAYRTALQRDAKSTWATRQLGYALFDVGQPGEAYTRLLEASTAFSKEASLFLTLGHSALQSKQVPQALTAYNKAVALAPTDGRFHLFLGLAKEQALDLAGAQASYRYAASLRPTDPMPFVHLGNLARASGDVTTARKEYLAALTRNGSQGWALMQLGFLELEQKRPEEATKRLTRAASILSDNADIVEALGDLAQERGETPKAEAEYRRALQRNRRQLGARIKLGDVLRGRGRASEALEQYQTAAEQNPASVWAQVSLGDGHATLKQYADAMVAYRRALQIQPQSGWALRQLGFALFESGDCAAAERTFAELPESTRAEAAVQLTQGHCRWRVNDVKLAKLHYARAREADVKNPAAALGLAEVFRVEGDFSQALQFAREAVTLAPTNTDAHILRGDMAQLALAAADGKDEALLAEATAAYDSALALDPAQSRAKRQLGFFLFRQKSLLRAQALLEAVRTTSPDDAEIPLTLGFIASAQKRPREALSLYRAAAALAPNDVRSLALTVQSLRELDQLDEALAVVEKALERLPEAAALHLELGYTRFARREARLALSAGEKAVLLDRFNPEAWLFVGRLRQRLFLSAGAVTAYETALTLAPDRAVAKRGLAGALLDRAEPGDFARGRVELTDTVIESLGSEALTHLTLGHLLARLSLAPGEDVPRGQPSKAKPAGQQAEERRQALVAFQRALDLAGDDEATRLSVGQGAVDLNEVSLARKTLQALVTRPHAPKCPKDEFELQWESKRGPTGEVSAKTPAEVEALEHLARLARARLLLGELEEREAQFAQARFEYACAISIAPDTAEAHLKLGLSLENKGLVRLAEEHAVSALLLKPDLKPAKDAVERLRREAGFPAGPLRLAAEAAFTSDALPLELAANVVRLTGVDDAERERLLTVPRTLRLGAAAAWRPQDLPDWPRFEVQYDALFGFGTFLTDRLDFENTISHAGSLRASGRLAVKALKRAEATWRAGYRLLGGSATSRSEWRHSFSVGGRLTQIQTGIFDVQLDFEHGAYSPQGGAELLERNSNALVWELRYLPAFSQRRIEGSASYRGRGVFLTSGRNWWTHRFDVDGLWRGDWWLAGGEFTAGVAADVFPTGSPRSDAGSIGLAGKAGLNLSGYTYALARVGIVGSPGNSAFNAARFGAEAAHRFFFRQQQLALSVSVSYETRWLFNIGHVDHLVMAFITVGR